MTPSRWFTVARLVWVIVAVFVTGTFLFTVPARLTETPSFASESQGITHAEFLEGLEQIGVSPRGYTLYRQWTGVIGPFIYLTLGIFIFWRKSNDWVALLTSFVFITFIAPFNELVRYHPIWQIVMGIAEITGSILLFLWFFIFPDGHFVPRWTRLVFFVLLGTQIWRIFQPEVYLKSFPVLAPLIFSGILIAQFYRYRHAEIPQRQQIKWVVLGVVAGALPLLLFTLGYNMFFHYQSALAHAVAFNLYGGFLWELFMLEFPISLTMAIFRSRLFDIDIIIRRTLQYSILTGLLGVVYFGSVVLFQSIFRTTSGKTSSMAIVLSTLIIAALFTPLRRRVQNVIDRRFYRQKYNAAQVLAHFATVARDEVEMEKLTAALVQVIQETVQPEKVSLWVKEPRVEQRKMGL